MILNTYVTCELSNNEEFWNLKKWKEDDNTSSDCCKHLNSVKSESTQLKDYSQN